MVSLPADLQEWARESIPDNCRAAWNQVKLVRDDLDCWLSKTYYTRPLTLVVSTHISVSVLLPVYRIFVIDTITITMRGNFSNWAISVNSVKEVKADFADLFDPTERIDSVYCEGFEPDWVYEPYALNKKKFTLRLSNNEKLHIFFFLLGHSLGLREK